MENRKWKLVNASYIGLGHEETNIPCQDSSTCFSDEKSNFKCVLVSDGCGSAKLSQYGSKLLADVIPSYLKNEFDNLFVLDENEIKIKIIDFIMDGIREQINKYISEVKTYVDDIEVFEAYMLFDATLVVGAIKDNRALFIHIGDGVIGYFNDNEINILSKEEKVDGQENVTYYPSTVKYYLADNDPNALSHARVFKIDDLTNYKGFILFTDGAEKSLIYKQKDNYVFSKQNVGIALEHAKSPSPFKSISNMLRDDYRLLKIHESKNDFTSHFITDDDVSLALIFDESFVNNFVSKEEEKKPAKIVKSPYKPQPISKKEEKVETGKTRYKCPLSKEQLEVVSPFISKLFSKEKTRNLYEVIFQVIEKNKKSKITTDGIKAIAKKVNNDKDFIRLANDIIELSKILKE